MEILLIQDVENLGKRGDRINVAKGYYRNYLGPQGKAILANEGNLRRLAEEDAMLARRDKKFIASASAIAEKVNGQRLVFKVQANEEGHLYGSVTEQAIAKELEEKGYKVDARHVQLEQHIKELGEYQVNLALHREVEASVMVSVVRE